MLLIFSEFLRAVPGVLQTYAFVSAGVRPHTQGARADAYV